MLLPILAWLTATAMATSGFPAEVASHVGMPCTPTCLLCHASPSGGGAASQPFGQAATARGLVTYDDASLDDALDQMQADGVDSDGDGTSDVDELVAGDDPNGGAAFCAGGEAPVYGCVAHVAHPPGRLVALAGLALAGVALRRRPAEASAG